MVQRKEKEMSRVYKSKEQYIETLAEVLVAREDFKDLEYRRHPTNGEEYMILTSMVGEVIMFNITGYSEARILRCVSLVECQGFGAVDNLITDFNKRLEIGKLFN
jgi:hypothetical protein